MNILESISIALDAIRAQKLRSGLTLLSVAIGVFAIMTTITAQTSLVYTVTKSLEALGENTFFVKRTPSIVMGNSWRKYRNRKDITYSQAKAFQQKMQRADLISIVNVSPGTTAKHKEQSTNPDVTLVGSDENYFMLNNFNLKEGRPFTGADISANRPAAVIGNDVAVKLFPQESPIGKTISVRNQKFTVIGLLEAKGAILGQSQDNIIIIPISFFSKYFASDWDESVQLIIRAPDRENFSSTVDEAIGVLRSLRNVKPWEENTFEVETSEGLRDQFSGFLDYLTVFGLIAGLFALIAAGIGIMNIMLISVKERTREIGIRKAIGARRSWIVTQFLIEATTLCIVGGLIGIFLGILAALGLSAAAGTSFSLPVFWIFGFVMICVAIGLTFGIYPAWKAAKLDPIEALRYE